MPGASSWKLSPSSTRIAVIESSMLVSGHTCTVFHVMMEDDEKHFSLVRYIQDFVELDALIHKHFPKYRIPLPKLQPCFPKPKGKSGVRSLFSLSRKKSNSELLEMYLRRCTLTSIGRSSLFHDFLSAQREEDRVISKLSVDQLVAHHVVTQAPSVARTIKRKDPFCHNSNPTESDGSTASTLLSSAPSITDETAPSSFTQDLRSNDDDSICFSVKLDELPPVPEESCHSTTIEDFQLIKVLGKGATGKVVLVRKRSNQRLFALKATTKSWNATNCEVERIKMERDILATLADVHHPFLIQLHNAFQDHFNLYFVLDYHPGADLATLLQRYIRFPAEQCRLYCAEMVMGLQELHRKCILYRDLKPENVLIAADGHIILTDFGLSKMFEQSGEKYEHRTQTFCGTPDYLAPEVIEGQEYSYAADFWSLGTMLYEMITGCTPFHAQTVDEMYERVLYDELLFPPKMDKEAMDLIAGLLVKEPIDRLGVGYGGVFELRTHAYFDGHLNWRDVYAKKIEPMYIPYRESETDLSHFDTDFLNMSTDLFEENSFDRYRVDQEHYPAGLAENAFRGFSYYMKEAPEGLPYPSEISFTNDDFMMYDEEMEYDDGQSFYRKYSFSDDGEEQFGVFQHFSRSVDSDDITSRPSSVYLKNNLRDLSMEPVSHQNLNIRNSFIETSAKENVAMLRS